MNQSRTLASIFVGLLLICPPTWAQEGTTATNAATQKTQASKGATTAAKPAGNAAAAGPVLRRSNRMEFDGRLIKGERAAGAVYLFHRVPRKLPALLNLQRDELDRIVWPVLRRGADQPKNVAKATKDGQRIAPIPAKAKTTRNKKNASKTRKSKKRRRWNRSKKKRQKSKGKSTR